MKKIRAEYPEEFLNKLTEQFVTGGLASGREDRVRAEIIKVRERNYDSLFLEMYFALKNTHHEDAIEALKACHEVMEFDEVIRISHEAEAELTSKMLNYLERKPSIVAKKGGEGRAAKFRALEAETIRLYKLGQANWPSGRNHAPAAALAITPQIVEFSLKGDGDLSPTTNKPLEWIRSHINAMKNNPS